RNSRCGIVVTDRLAVNKLDPEFFVSETGLDAPRTKLAIDLILTINRTDISKVAGLATYRAGEAICLNASCRNWIRMVGESRKVTHAFSLFGAFFAGAVLR